MVKIASLKGFLLLWKSKLKELLKRLKNWLKRYWSKKTINKFMIIPTIINLDKNLEEIEKQKRDAINEQLCEAMKTKKNSAYYGISQNVDLSLPSSIIDQGQGYIETPILYTNIKFLNGICNLVAKFIHKITLHDIALNNDQIYFYRNTGGGGLPCISYYSFFLIILFLYSIYR